MRINDFYVFFKSLKRLTGIKCAREQHLSTLPYFLNKHSKADTDIIVNERGDIIF